MGKKVLFLIRNSKSFSRLNLKSGPNSLDWKSHSLFVGLLVAAGYYVGSLIGFELTFKEQPISMMWPPNSILLGALLLLPSEKWKVVFIAALPVHFLIQVQSDVPLLMASAWFITNCSEALI